MPSDRCEDTQARQLFSNYFELVYADIAIIE